MSRSEQLQQKENAFLDMKTGHIKELTQALTVNSYGEDEKCSLNAFEQSNQPYTTMTLQQASEGFSKLTKGISIDEVIDDNDSDEQEFDLPGIPIRNVDGVEVINNVDVADVTVNGFDVTGLPKGFNLTDSQKECLAEMRKVMEKGQMLAFVHGPSRSGKTTTARLRFSTQAGTPPTAPLKKSSKQTAIFEFSNSGTEVSFNPG